jgi:hypothetical protein
MSKISPYLFASKIPSGENSGENFQRLLCRVFKKTLAKTEQGGKWGKASNTCQHLPAIGGFALSWMGRYNGVRIVLRECIMKGRLEEKNLRNQLC